LEHGAQVKDVDAIIQRMARAGYADAEIGRHLGWDRLRVFRRRCALGIKSGHNPTLGAMIARLNLRRRIAA
jgi:hypothetical protein